MTVPSQRQTNNDGSLNTILSQRQTNNVGSLNENPFTETDK